VYVFEPRKMNVFSATGEFVRSASFPGRPPSGFAVTKNGSIVVAAHINTPERVGFPLHLLDVDGTVLRSFAGTGTAYSSDDDVMFSQIVATAQSPESIWSARIRAYEIEEWQPRTNTKVRRIERNAAWFDEGLRDRGPMGSRLRWLREDEDGLLWTIVNVLTDDYASHTQAGTPINEYFDTIIEVLDPDKGELVATLRHDNFFFVWAGAFTFSTRVDEELNVIVDVWRASLQGRQN
jgi:hypothetical protein